MNKLDLRSAAEYLRTHDDYLLITHRDPDGDAVGSLFALYLVLRSLDKRVGVIHETMPKDISRTVVDGAELDFEPRTVVALDCGSAKQIGGESCERWRERTDLSIDHHAGGTPFADNDLIVPEAAATCEILFDLFCILDADITPAIAERLYIGLSTDTGCFRYSNTTAHTLQVASYLVATGIDNGELNTLLFETKTVDQMRFEAQAVDAMRFYYDGRCCLIALPNEIYRRYHLDDSHTNVVTSMTRRAEGVLIGVTVKEKKPGVFRASVRTNPPVDAAAVCAVLGGGGHKRAAGCEIDARDIEAAAQKMIEVVGTFLS